MTGIADTWAKQGLTHSFLLIKEKHTSLCCIIKTVNVNGIL